MPYATIDDLTHFGVNPDAHEHADITALEAALDAASSEADSYLSKVYTLPVTSWGAALRMHVSAMAAYNVIATRGFDPSGVDGVLEKRRQDALDWLKMLATGVISDPSIEDSTPGVVEGGAAVVSQPKRGW